MSCKTAETLFQLNLVFFSLNLEILAKLLILTSTLTLTPQLSPNRKPHLKCA